MSRTSTSVSRLWILAPPVIWIAAFGVVYLVAEWTCTEDVATGDRFGVPLVSLIVIGVILGAALLTVASIVVVRRIAPEAGSPSTDRATFRLVGVLLGWLFLVSTLVVGVPVLFLEPC